MEAKKNPDKDLYRKSPQFFLIGLSISIGLTIMAFEWETQVIERHIDPQLPDGPTLLTEIPITKLERPKLPDAVKAMSTSHSEQPVIIIEAVSDDAEQDSILFDPFGPIDPGLQATGDEKELTEETYTFVEVQPQPVGGMENFYRDLVQKIKYPHQARKMEVEGKVFVEFVVNKSGEPTDLRIMKGIGAGCDEEAMRVIALTKWEPGKQRGISVRVRMVMPVYFKLN